MAMDDKSRVNLYVRDNRKKEWDRYVDESPEIETLSQLVRVAVTKYINRDSSQGTPQAPVPDGESSTDPRLLEGINAIQSNIEDLDDRLLSVESELSKNPELRDITNKVFEILPETFPASKKHQETKDAAELSAGSDDENVVWSGEVGDIADHLGIKEGWARMACEKLDSDSNRVLSQEVGDTILYWKSMGQDDGYGEWLESYGMVPDDDDPVIGGRE